MWGSFLFSGLPFGGLVLLKLKRHRLPDVIGQVDVEVFRLSFKTSYQGRIGAQVDPVSG